MTEDQWSSPLASVKPHDHAVFVYDEGEDLLMPLETFLQEGMERGDLSAFVHAFGAPEEAREFLGQRIDGIEDHEQGKHLALAHHKEAFERNGRIDHDHVAGVVGMLKEAASGGGRKGVRIFVDASRRYFDEGRVEEWFAFESWLGPKLQADVGLVCAYRASDLRKPDVLARVLKTHGYRFHAGPAKP